jgi:type III restriction enzyme
LKLQFESNLDYQLEAIESVCDLFRGQEICRSEFTVTGNREAGGQLAIAFSESDLGIGNRLSLPDDAILNNLNDIQLRNGLPPSPSLQSGDFTVEMETGTGKTYVYLRTIFELNKRYGFTKFVIVVPSVAIKEGVRKSLEITGQHLRGLYDNAPFDFFIYDSDKLGLVRDFATSPQIRIMIVTVGSINKKDVNNLYKDSEKVGGEKPIDLIRATRPILIVDEPQSVDGGLDGRGREALGAMHPLCTLRYSATHADKFHMVYRLDAVDAYERRLVKQIEVASATVEAAHNKPFVRLLAVHSVRGSVSARVELDVAAASGVQRRVVTVMDGEDLERAAGRTVYAGCRIGEIRAEKGRERLELRVPGGEYYLDAGQAYGDVDALALQREMIRRTIKEHLDKQLRLRKQDIKVLSLFFVDSVDKYRKYDEEGRPVRGDYALIFEEEYRRFAAHPDYRSLFEGMDASLAAEEAHGGYFSIDKRRVGKTTVEFLKDTSGSTKADDDTYNLIMRDKERLLSLETPLQFIFSHSALREGWDNPNVFQICTLRDIHTERERRQTIGRGLRLAVNQSGERVRGFDVNTLTVIAMESYELFAEQLQKEIEADTGIRFGIVERHHFAAIPINRGNGRKEPLGFEASRTLWESLQARGYLGADGKAEDSLRMAIQEGTLVIPGEYETVRTAITEVLRKLSGRLGVKNADERRQVRTRQALLQSADFKALWDRIKHKTTYRVHFDNEKLIRECTGSVQLMPPVTRTRMEWRKADIAIGKAGVEATEREGSATVMLEEAEVELPDLLTELQDRTQLTRRTLHRILTGSSRLPDFMRNPQQFIEETAEAVNRNKRLALVDGIKYQRLGDEHYYAQELFENKELTGYLKNMLVDARKSVYEHVVHESGPEQHFADQLEKNDSVRLYAKLPGWFTVPTPLGSYNPDWAVLIENDGLEQLYFVVETKSSLQMDDLRDSEAAKIACGRVHFEELAIGDSAAKYVVARHLGDVLSSAE